MKHSLSITLTESVVFLRTADRISRHRVIPIDAPPSIVRGLLSLTLEKPTRISTINISLNGIATNSWTDGVGSRRIDYVESVNVYSAESVFFDASQSPTSRRTVSLGPSVLHNSEDGPPRLSRRFSVDSTFFHRDHDAPPYTANITNPTPPSSPHSLSRQTTTASRSGSRDESRGRRPSRFSFASIFGRVRSPSPRENSPSPNPRGRDTGPRSALTKLLGNGPDEDPIGWKEFKPGTYTYPISFTIPANSPPSLQLPNGSIIYKLKASVHRPGTFRPKLTASRVVTVISCPGEDDMDEHESLVVERTWENQMQYLISISGKMFYLGGVIPIDITFVPMAKVKIHRIAVYIEERVDYYVQMKRVGKSDPINRVDLLSLRSHQKDGPPILPLQSDSPDAFGSSPLYPLFFPSTDVDVHDDQRPPRLPLDPSEIASTLMGPGPWSFHAALHLPPCSVLRFTNRNKKSNIVVGHVLKLVFRAERGDETEKEGKKKLFDIIVQVPIQVLSCRCNPDWTSLPEYEEIQEEREGESRCPCRWERERWERERVTRTSTRSNVSTAPITPTHTRNHIPFPSTPPHPHNHAGPSSQSHPHTNHIFDILHDSLSHSIINNNNNNSEPHHLGSPTMPTLPELDSLFHRNEQFERLISGQESEIGEAPPAYCRVVPVRAV